MIKTYRERLQLELRNAIAMRVAVEVCCGRSSYLVQQNPVWKQADQEVKRLTSALAGEFDKAFTPAAEPTFSVPHEFGTVVGKLVLNPEFEAAIDSTFAAEAAIILQQRQVELDKEIERFE
jgi:hypothetical protein